MRRRYTRAAVGISVVGLIVITAPSMFVRYSGAKHIVTAGKCPEAQVAIVLGAGVKPNGRLSDMLADRVMTGVELYKAGKVRKLLMTGDHGRQDYDEVNAMRRYAEAKGVPTEDIFMDHAGFCTYDSMYRAKSVFRVKSAIVVTQRFHLPRAVFLARSLGIDATGAAADKQRYRNAMVCEIREIPARCQDFVRAVIVRPKPKYLGPAIPITGDGCATHD